MKYLVILFMLFSVTAFSQRTDVSRLRPAPTGEGVLGSTLINGVYKYGFIAASPFGTVIDTCTAAGLVVVPVSVQSASYQVFVTPISTLGLHAAISAKTDSSFTAKFWLNDTVANLRPVVFDYLIKE